MGRAACRRQRLAIIREHGGEIGETYGVPVEAIVQGIRSGVRKVYIDTDLRLAMSGAMRRLMATDRKEFDPRKFFKAARDAARALRRALRGLRLRRPRQPHQAAGAGRARASLRRRAALIRSGAQSWQ